jgi:hypothetical protein
MDTYDPNLHQQHRTKAIEARMAYHEKVTRTILILMSALAAVASGLLLYHLLDRQ